MEISAITDRIDSAIEALLAWIGNHGAGLFDGLRAVLEGGYGGVLWLLRLAPASAVAVLFGLAAWRLVGRAAGVMSAAALLVCAGMGLWADTTATLALVVAATLMSLTVGIPIGILAGFSAPFDRLLQPMLDLIQTLPPYIYLLPSIALLGYGPATALAATFIVALPPAIRLTSLGIRLTPGEFIELGQASGLTPWQMFTKIRLPFAIPSLMAGVNQSLMMAFGMVVIAGIVGSGGLGQTIYEAVRKLDIATSIDAAIAIVILTIILDRLTQSAARRAHGGRS